MDPPKKPGVPKWTPDKQERLRVITEVKDKKLKIVDAARLLGLSAKQVGRLRDTLEEEGPSGLLHKGREREPPNKTPQEVRNLVRDLAANKFVDVAPTLFAYLLEDLHGIRPSPDTIQRILTEAGLWARQRRKPLHRAYRERKPCRGMLVQMDTSYHDWFGPDVDKCYLISMIDDATSDLFCRFHT
jgi:transposase-like protein